MNTYLQKGYVWMHTSSTFLQQYPIKLYKYIPVLAIL